MSEPTAGSELGGRYVLDEEIGRGGFGVVWSAEDTERDRTVALKHPNYDGNADAGLVDKYFEREYDVLEDIRTAGDHPNIMTYFDRVEGHEMPFLVLELIEGSELGTVVRTDSPITDPDEVREIGIRICDALSFLHDHDIIYRDLKPDNIMLNGSLDPKLIDFTTAKGFVVDDEGPGFTDGSAASTGPGSDADSTVPGEFKPPELNRGSDQRQGPWSDVYSIGKLLCFLQVGWVPDEDGVAPSDFGVDSADYLDEIIVQATQHDHTDRYPNASMLRRALEDRSATMPSRATIEWLGRDEAWRIYPGDTIGRETPDGPRPSILLEDGSHKALSAVHCRFETDDDGTWRVIDTSLNGTYISKHDEQDWQPLLSETGQERRREAGESIPDDPAVEAELEDGDVVALVSPGYPERFYFRFSQ
jgi:serine/threonine-protein kinase